MTGDVVGVRDAYLEVMAALRERRLTASDVAARVRLSKTPEAYLANKATRPEAAYEALLMAGRTTWSPGERVRFYRTRGGSVWIPEESEETSAGQGWERREGEEKERSQRAGAAPMHHDDVANRRDYDMEHYLRVLFTSYAARLRKAYTPDDFERLFRTDEQLGLFDQPIEQIQPIWIRYQAISD
jgi:DNA polymerase, archaea type